MTKKLIVVILSVVLCLAVVGGCFALYTVNAPEIKITFGSESAVTLSTSLGAGVTELNFGGASLSPANRSATQVITLDVSTNDKASLAGMSGELTVTISGAAASVIDLSATYTEGGEPKELKATDGTLKTTLPLNNLPKDFTLKVEIPTTVNAATFKTNSNKSADIKVSWKAITWAPVENGYYIVGDMSGWSINQDAILLDKDLTGTTDIAAIERVTLKAGDEFKIRKYVTGQGGDEGWQELGYKDDGSGDVNIPADGSIIVKNVKDATSNISVAADGDYFVCVNQYGKVWIAKATTPAA